MKSKASVKKSVSFFAAAALTVTALAGCAAGGSDSSSKGLDAAFDYAKAQVSSYSSQQTYLSAVFADQAFSTANAAAMMLDGKTAQEDLEKAARYLFLDSITIADENGKVIASYPEGEEGKSIKEISDKATFIRVVKGVVVKTMTDPEAVEGTDEYSLYAGVNRADGSGAVVVGFTTSDYNDVTGANVAKQCGVNTVVLKDGSVISSTLEKAETGATLDSLGVKSGDIEKGSFKMTVDGTEYQCKAGVVDEFTVITAEPA